MENKNNIRETKVNQIVTIGRIKGSISSGDKVYKSLQNILLLLLMKVTNLKTEKFL